MPGGHVRRPRIDESGKQGDQQNRPQQALADAKAIQRRAVVRVPAQIRQTQATRTTHQQQRHQHQEQQKGASGRQAASVELQPEIAGSEDRQHQEIKLIDDQPARPGRKIQDREKCRQQKYRQPELPLEQHQNANENERNPQRRDGMRKRRIDAGQQTRQRQKETKSPGPGAHAGRPAD